MSVDLSSYKLTFEDEFTGSYLNSQVWGTKYWWGGRSLSSNGEKQYFADRSTAVVQKHPSTDPFKIVADTSQTGDGVLTITASKSPDTSLTDGLPYVSGMINTYGTFSQTYGYFEIKAQVPTGTGLWPAFWMLPQSGNWPPEIDVLELLGKDPKTYYVGAHWSGTGGSHQHQTTAINKGIDLSQRFHTYGTMWTASTISFYLDGVQVHSMATPPGATEPMYLLAGLAVGGTWGGDPDTTTKFPAEFKIDYIKAWALDPLLAYTPTVKGTDGNDDGFGSSKALIGTLGQDVIFGYGGNDIIEGLGGDDIFSGAAGADTFRFLTSGSGRDIILDFDPLANDVVQVAKGVAGVKNFAALYRNVTNNAEGDAVLKLASGNTITFDGVTKAKLGYDDFAII
jgi:beta-glucanase (GH16 family)